MHLDGDVVYTDLVRHLGCGRVGCAGSEGGGDDGPGDDGVVVEARHELDVHGALERLPLLVLQRPVGAPRVLHGHKPRRVRHPDGHGRDVARSAHVLDQHAEPVWARPGVQPKHDLLVCILAWHSLVHDGVQALVSQFRVLPRKRHGVQRGPAEVERLLPWVAAVSPTRAEVRHHHRGAVRVAELAVAALHLVALATSQTVREYG